MLGVCSTFLLLAPLAHLAWQQLEPELASSERRLQQNLQFGGQPQPLPGGQPDDLDPQEKRAALLLSNALHGTIPIVVLIVFACVYKARVTNQRPMWPQEGSRPYRNAGDFSVGAFDCFDDVSYCLHGTFCHLVRVSDTVHAVGFMDFWMAMLVQFGVLMAASILSALLSTYGHSLPLALMPALLSPAVMVFFRQNIRQKLSGNTVPAFADTSSIMVDFALWCFCSWCATIQEAREVDLAIGARVDCCCSLMVIPGMMPSAPVLMSGQPMQGQPMQLQPMQLQMQGRPLVGQPVHVGGF